MRITIYEVMLFLLFDSPKDPKLHTLYFLPKLLLLLVLFCWLNSTETGNFWDAQLKGTQKMVGIFRRHPGILNLPWFCARLIEAILASTFWRGQVIQQTAAHGAWRLSRSTYERKPWNFEISHASTTTVPSFGHRNTLLNQCISRHVVSCGRSARCNWN